jgi:multicomponent Na+:H+ antiporter subunit F
MNLSTVIEAIVIPLLCGAFVLGFVRLVIGPTLPDRIMAFELVSTSSAGIIVSYAVLSGVPLLLDVASVWAIISFLSVIAFAYYIERWRGEP